MAKVFAVVVTFNGMKWMDRCLGSLAGSKVPVSTVVIDNASTDGTPDYIENHFPDAHLIRSEVNYGFAKANNIGIRHALDNGADYVFLLNQDAWVEKNTIGSLCEMAADDASIGIVSPIHLNGSGDALDWGFCGHVPSNFVSDSYCGELRAKYYCDFVNAAAWLMTRACIEKVGGFDTLMFVHYGEDSNYCQRVKYHGFKVAICSAATILHDREFRKANEKEYRSKNFRQDDLNRRLEFANILYDIDVDAFIAQNETSIKKSYLKLKFKQARRLKGDMEFLRKAKTSRETNKKVGLNWL